MPAPSAALPDVPKLHTFRSPGMRSSNNLRHKSISFALSPKPLHCNAGSFGLKRTGTYRSISSVSTGYRRTKRSDALARLEGRKAPYICSPSASDFMSLSDDEEEDEEEDTHWEEKEGHVEVEKHEKGEREPEDDEGHEFTDRVFCPESPELDSVLFSQTIAAQPTKLMTAMLEDENVIFPSPSPTLPPKVSASPSEQQGSELRSHLRRRSATVSLAQTLSSSWSLSSSSESSSHSVSSSKRRLRRASQWNPLKSFIDLSDMEDDATSAPWRSYIEISGI